MATEGVKVDDRKIDQQIERYSEGTNLAAWNFSSTSGCLQQSHGDVTGRLNRPRLMVSLWQRSTCHPLMTFC